MRDAANKDGGASNAPGVPDAPGVAPARRVTFYTKAGCHLCERAEELLEDLAPHYNLRVTAVDITADLTLFERYRYEIPVIVVEGGGAISGRIDAAGLWRALERAP